LGVSGRVIVSAWIASSGTIVAVSGGEVSDGAGATCFSLDVLSGLCKYSETGGATKNTVSDFRWGLESLMVGVRIANKNARCSNSDMEIKITRCHVFLVDWKDVSKDRLSDACCMRVFTQCFDCPHGVAIGLLKVRGKYRRLT